MFKKVQIMWGYIFVFSLTQPLSLFLHIFLKMINPLFISIVLMIIFLHYYQILPLEHSNYLLGFRIEEKNLDLH